jgi:hypothetical protein
MKAAHLLAGMLLLCVPLAKVRAVVFYSTGDPTYNTSPPTGSLAGSGWQWVGVFDGYAGTPIGPHYFIAAHHIGGAIGDTIVFGGVSYTTSAYYDDTASDLRIWQVTGTFPCWAPLYRGSSEAGQGLVVFGYGLSRGGPVVNQFGTLTGWYWGSNGGILRWGQNTVYRIVNGGSYWGQLLYSLFNQNGGPNVADLALGDSSAPVFINDGTGWTLAGVAAAVDSSFNTTDTGNGFVASLIDSRGLYYSSTPPDNWQLITGPQPVPSGFYATQISVRAGWIDSIVPPEPPDCPATSEPAMPAAHLVLLACLTLGVGVAFLRRAPGPAGAIR